MKEKLVFIIKQAWFVLGAVAQPSRLSLLHSKLGVRERNALFAAYAVFSISLFASLGFAYYSVTEVVPVPGDTYREGILGQPINVNPVLSRNNDVDREIIELLFSSLLKSNGRGGTVPDLADRYEMSEDGRVWSIYLKENAYWHDGKPVTADDVIFTIESVQDPDAKSPLYNSWQGVVPERVGISELKLYLRSNYAAFEENLKDLKIIPKHIFESIPRANFHLSGYNLEPVGSGPFKFSSLTRRKDGFITSYVLDRNTKYHLGDVFLDKFAITFFENTDDLVDAFNSREIDGFGGIAHDHLAGIRAPSRIFKFAMPRYYAVFFNQSIATQLESGVVREALRLATDKGSLAKFVFGDYAQVVNGPIVKGMLGYAPEGDGPEYDPDRANQMLDNDGWGRGEDGIRTKKDVKLELELIVPETDQLVRTADILKSQWEKIGVSLTVIRVPVSEVTNEYMKNRTYPMLLFGNIANFNTDLFAFWHSSQKLHQGLNLSLFDDKKADGLIESSRQELDKAEREKQLREVDALIRSRVPAVFLFSPDYLYVTNNKLRGIEELMVVTPGQRFSQIEQWSVKQARVFK